MDVHALLQIGTPLDDALARAPQFDAGFSPLTLAWVLRDWESSAVAALSGWTPEQTGAMDEFRKEIIEALTLPTRTEPTS